MRTLFALLLASALALGLATPPVLASGGGNNIVLATTSGTDRVQTLSGVMVAPTGSDTVDNDNLAYAESNDCTDCRTVAVALQAVLITRDADQISPTNAAVAINGNCTRCETFAFASQYVISTGGPVYLSRQGQQEVARIRAEAAAVAASDADFTSMDGELQLLAEEFRAVIDAELRRAGRPADGRLTHEVATRQS